MSTIAVRFTAGRYHATPWGRHVNEGEVEWPPSPWRVLRALLSVGFTKRGWWEVPEDATGLIEKLASVLPVYRLPPGIAAHTRHFMPIRAGRGEKTTKVLDAFVRIADDTPMLIHFPADLEEPERATLADLVQGLGYLGRAESWVEARVVEGVEPDESWTKPAAEVQNQRPQFLEEVTLLAPVDPASYREWREMSVNGALSGLRERKGKEPTKRDIAKVQSAHPADLLACLLTATGDLQSQGWTQPPGSRAVLYRRPASSLELRPARPPVRRQRIERVEAALLSLASQRPSARVLPLLTRALPQMELLHRSLVSILGEDAVRCPVLSGRDPASGRPLRRRHGHAHYMPLDLDEDGRVDHVVVYAPDGLDALAQQAVRGLRRTWMKGEDRDIVVALAGMGSLSRLERQLRTRSGRNVAELATSRQWASVTPFVPPRHLKKRKHTLDDQVRDELHTRGLPEPEQIEAMDREELIRRRLLGHVLARKGGKPQPPSRRAFGLRLVFHEPVTGPVSLGYGSHYGLGMFGAEGHGE